MARTDRPGGTPPPAGETGADSGAETGAGARRNGAAGEDLPAPEAQLIAAETLSRSSAPLPVALEPGAEARAALAEALGLVRITKVRLQGTLVPSGDAGWRLDATLGATVVQSCVITLEDVKTRIDVPVTRLYTAAAPEVPERAAGEVEWDGEETAEPLGAGVDLAAVIAEEVDLALPAYPRAPGAALPAEASDPDGADKNPFDALAVLKSGLKKPD